MDIDYSTLSQKLSRDDKIEAATWREVHGSSRMGYAALCFLMIAVGVYVAAIAVFAGMGYYVGSDSSGVTLALLALPVLAMVSWQYKRQLERQERLYLFARNNQALYVANQPAPPYEGMIFDEGHTQVLKEALVFENGIEVGNYQYVTSYGRYRQVHKWSFAAAPLSRKLPHMVLDAKSNNLFGLSNLPDSFYGQKVSLEGDFDSYFTLYAPNGYDRDVRYVFTPDVMTALIDAGRHFDIEVIDDVLILYTKGFTSLESEAQLKKILLVVDALSDKISHQSRRYADERAGDWTLNAVAEPGRRLVPNTTASVVVGIIALLALLYLQYLR